MKPLLVLIAALVPSAAAAWELVPVTPPLPHLGHDIVTPAPAVFPPPIWDLTFETRVVTLAPLPRAEALADAACLICPAYPGALR